MCCVVNSTSVGTSQRIPVAWVSRVYRVEGHGPVLTEWKGTRAGFSGWEACFCALPLWRAHGIRKKAVTRLGRAMSLGLNHCDTPIPVGD